MALRKWGAREICSQPELVNHLCNPKSEMTQDGCQWRHTCVQVHLSENLARNYLCQLSILCTVVVSLCIPTFQVAWYIQ